MLTPIDIQNRNLKTTMGGYNKKDTDDFLATILESYEELYKENKDLKEKITSLSEGVQYYKQMENTLQKALVLAEKTSAETQEAAKVQADSMMRESQVKAEALVSDAQVKADSLVTDAQNKADTLVTDAQNKAEALVTEAQNKANLIKNQSDHELDETRSHIRKLVQSYESYRLQFKKLASSQIEMLESEVFDIYAPEIDKVVEETKNAQEDFEDIKEDIPETADIAETTDNSSIETNNEVTKEEVEIPAETIEVEKNVAAEPVQESKIEWTEPDSEPVQEAEFKPVEEDKPEIKEEPTVEAVQESTVVPVEEPAAEAKFKSASESPFINPLDMLETSTPFVDIPGTSTKSSSSDKVETSPFIDIPDMPEVKPEKKASDTKAASESPFVRSFDDFTTPVVDDIKGADVSETAYPETKKEEKAPAYVDYFMPNMVDEPKTAKEEAAASKDSSPFVFIDPE